MTGYKCRYCNKEFIRESTLASHLCEKKRRAQQENETGVQLGYRSYLRFYEITQNSSKVKTYEDFSNSPYYLAFVKYGRYLCDIRAVNTTSFTDWLLKNNVRLDQWCKDSLYHNWLKEYLKKEAVQDALERALKEMTKYAEDNPELKNGFTDYFRYGNSNRICYHISTGRVSPWVVYNCASGVAFLDSLREDQVLTVVEAIDPDFWKKKFHDYPEDVAWTKTVLEKAGL